MPVPTGVCGGRPFDETAALAEQFSVLLATLTGAHRSAIYIWRSKCRTNKIT
jgi:hypothetical protein